jgi:hypothetical protein
VDDFDRVESKITRLIQESWLQMLPILELPGVIVRIRAPPVALEGVWMSLSSCGRPVLSCCALTVAIS